MTAAERFRERARALARASRHERFRAALVLVLLIGVFLARPLARIRDHHYCFADFVQSFSLINVEPGRLPANKEMGDPAVAFLPWLLFSRDELRAGRMPLWNPHNGGGVPLLANYQSAVFSPYSVPFYVLGLRYALLVSAFLKLFSIGFFTFLFLRLLRLETVAALVGAVIHTFGGYYVVWLSGPHTGTAASLPATFYFAERLLQALEAGLGPRFTRAPVIGLCASLAAGLLGGHPETWCAGAVLLAAYCLVRLRGAWRLYPSFLLAGLLAVGIAAVQLLPFTEYLARSESYQLRARVEGEAFSLPPRAALLLLFPEALGNATDAHDLAVAWGTSFAEMASRHLGGFALLLAAWSARYAGREPRLRFFLAALALWIVYSWNPLGLAALFRLIPGLSLVHPIRTSAAFLFSASCLAAFAVHYLGTSPDPRRALRSLLVAGVLVAGAGAFGLHRLFAGAPPALAGQPARLTSALRAETAWLVLGMAAGLLFLHLRGPRRGSAARAVGAAGLLAVAFLQGGHRLRAFNPTIEDRFVYPRTGTMDVLERTVGRSRVAVVASEAVTLVSSTNLVYRLSMPAAHDALWIRPYDELYRRFFGLTYTRSPRHADERGLALFGVDYVLTDGPLPNGAHVEAHRAAPFVPAGEILPGATVEQEFVPDRNGLSAVAVFLATYARVNECTLDVVVEQMDPGQELGRQRLDCRHVGNHRWSVVRFGAQANSRGRRHRVVLSSPDARPGSAVTVLVNPVAPSLRGSLRVGGRPREGILALDHAPHQGQFEKLVDFPVFTLYRYSGAPGRFYTVGRVRRARSDEEALALLEGDEDVGTSVVLNRGDAPAVEGPAGKVEIGGEEPRRVTLRATRSAPGILVTTMAHYPGWRATVAGAAVPILRANHAFMAVALPPGRSEIVFTYEPTTFSAGGAISLACVLGAAALAVSGRRRGRDAQ